MDDKQIVIIHNDKDPVLTRVFRTKFDHEVGWKSLITSDFDEAIKLAKDDTVSVIVTEVMCNDGNGRDGFDLVRELNEITDKKVVVLSELSQDEDRKRALDSGADYYFVKSDISLLKFIEELKGIIG